MGADCALAWLRSEEMELTRQVSNPASSASSASWVTAATPETFALHSEATRSERYAWNVAEIKDLLERIEDRDRELEAMSPEACREAAAVLREAKSRLTSERQRQLADEIARDFEARAAAHGSRSASP